MKILIVTDTGTPQINGVVRTIEFVSQELQKRGHVVQVAHPDACRLLVFPAPFYRNIKLEFLAHARLARMLSDFSPDYIHIATEGPLGWAARRLCLRQRRSFTTSYHTNFPDYLAKRSPRFAAPLVAAVSYAILRRFHAPSSLVMVPSLSIENELAARGFRNLKVWTRGVDAKLFRPHGKTLKAYENLPRPILLYVGRVAVEKNLPAFLDLRTTGSKVIIGDGPEMAYLQKRYASAYFLGPKAGEELARHYAAADVFVFPSKTDTFGLVLLEAAASGLRIAAYPAPGPADLFESPESKAFAVLDHDLQQAVDKALALPNAPRAPHVFASRYSWEKSAEDFFENLHATPPHAIGEVR